MLNQSIFSMFPHSSYLLIDNLEGQGPVDLCVGVLLVHHVEHVQDVRCLQHVAVLAERWLAQWSEG